MGAWSVVRIISGWLVAVIAIFLADTGMAWAQSRLVVPTEQPVHQPVVLEPIDSSLGVLASLNDFDALGLVDRPTSYAAADVIEEAIAFATADGHEYALGNLALGSLTSEICDMFPTLEAAANSYEYNVHIVVEGIRAGVLPIDAASSGYTQISPETWVEFGMTREEALDAIASHPAASAWLRQAALGQLLFELRLESERQFLWALTDFCRAPTDIFKFDRWSAAGCNPSAGPDRFVQRSLHVKDEIIDFLYRMGVRNFDLSCVTLDMGFRSKAMGNLVLTNVAIEVLAAPNAKFDTLTVKQSVVTGWIDLSSISVSRQLELRDVTLIEDTLDLPGAQLAGGAVFNNLAAPQGLVLSHAQVQGPLRISGSTIGPRPSDTGERYSLELYATAAGSLVVTNSAITGYTDARYAAIGGEVYIANNAFGDPGQTEGPNGIGLIGADIRELLRVVDTVINGSLSLDGASIEEVRIQHSEVSHQLRMERAEIGTTLEVTGTTVGDYSNFDMLSTDGEVRIRDSVFGASPTQNTTVSFRSARFGVGLSFAGTRIIGSVNLEAAAAGTLTLSATQMSGRLWVNKAQIARGIRINGIQAAAGDFSLLTNEGETFISDSAFGDPARTDDDGSAELLTFYGATLQRTLWLNSLSVHGSAGLRAGAFDAVVMQDSVITGNLSMTDSSLGAVRIGESGGVVIGESLVVKSITSQMFLLMDSVIGNELSAPNATFGSMLNMTGVDVHGPVNLRRAVARTVGIYGLRASAITAAGLAVENNVELDYVSADTVWLDGIAADYLGINTALSGSPSTQDGPQAYALGDCGIPDVTGLRPPSVERASALVNAARQLRRGGERCLNILSVKGANVSGNVSIGGTISALLDASSSNVGGQFALAGAGARYGEGACAIARNVRADTIIYDLLDQTGQAANPYAPSVVDVYGADFRMISSSEPHTLTRPDNAAGQDYLRPFLGGTSGCGRVGQSGRVSEYQPAIYDALAAGQERAGNLDLARRIKVLKNRAYAETLTAGSSPIDQATVYLTRAIYGLADLVSGFGYENIKAIVWLGGITLFGYFLAWIGEERLARWLDPIFSRHSMPPAAGAAQTARIAAVATSRGPQRDAKGRYRAGAVPATPPPSPPPPVPTGPRRAGVFFVLDRSVPSLSLDDAFGKHEGLGFYLSSWYYIQRILCFVILLLMVAGALNVFQ